VNKDIVVLVIDDEPGHADVIVEALEKSAAKAVAIYNSADALEIVRKQRFDVVITDLKLNNDVNGLEILDEVKKHNPATEVILITAYATIDTCKEAIRRGAYDYLVKPIDIEQLRAMVKRAARRAIATYPNAVPEAETDFLFEDIRGTSPAMKGIFDVLGRVSPTNITVLVEGESGTGKELLARAIHNNSTRRTRPFVPVNCAGLSESLLESELFGHVKGAFTGAAADRKGLFEIADKGTLFLDEIGDMPMSMQAKLLRVLEDGLVVPVGASKPIVVDVRLISATNHDLIKLVEEKKFRQDLYYRIKGVSISVPPLRDRAVDIPELADYFLKEAAAEINKPITSISPSAMNILTSYSWPGNVRQLRNCIRTMVVMCDRQQLDVQDIPPEIHPIRQLAGATSDSGGLRLDELEKQAIADTLARMDGNREKAAKILGIGERTLYRKIKEYNL
jgi:DNA-binding NtrC family response regulator